MSQSPSDPYEILQVSRNAELDVIEAAYRRLARKRHPDVSGSPEAHRQMQLLNWAYELLRDPVARAQYDRHHPVPRPSGRRDGEWETVAPPADYAPDRRSVTRPEPTGPQASGEHVGRPPPKPQRGPRTGRWIVVLGVLAVLCLAVLLFGGGGTDDEPTPTPTRVSPDGSVIATMPLVSPGPRPTQTHTIRKVATSHVMEELGRAGFELRSDGTVGGYPAYRANYDSYVVMVLVVGEPSQLVQAEMTIFYNEMGRDTPGFPLLIRAIAPDLEDTFLEWVVQVTGQTHATTRIDNLDFNLTRFTNTELGSGSTLTVTVR